MACAALGALALAGCGDQAHLDVPSFAAKATCAACHLDQYHATKQPNHAKVGAPATCETCHTTAAWWPAAFPMHDEHFKLDGRHASLACAECHQDHVFDATPAECWGCHQKDYEGADDPNHVAAGYPKTCPACHTTAAWKPADFTGHDNYWPLTGQHTKTACGACHQNNVYAGTPRDCDGCHDPDYVAAKDPPHAEVQIPKACETCHTTVAWKPSSFGHDGWPLTGKHQVAECGACHKNGVFEGTATACVGCHKADYDATTDPSHVGAGFPTTCETCHTTGAWTPSSFDHGSVWPLTGKHQTAACGTCHKNGVFKGTPTACVGCHQPDYDGTTDPNHVTAGYPKACDGCHSTTGWKPASFANHDAFWPLTGKHQTTACGACHKNEVYQGTPKACAGCHQPDFDATTDPAHKAAGFPTTCETCHTTAAWTPSSFDHDVAWPLTGKHQTTACGACHKSGVYAGTPKACVGCHKADYDGTTDPNHVTSGYPTTCEACHATTAWKPATFTNHDAFWPLTGQHKTTPCGSCHVGGVYQGTPTACSGCHTPDWQGATNPSHSALALPKTCDTCHTAASWDTQKFPGHDKLFPITSGKHKYTCDKCHLNQNAWWDFKCTTCHNLSEMNSEHSGEVSGYSSTLSSAKTVDWGCYKCHPAGND